MVKYTFEPFHRPIPKRLTHRTAYIKIRGPGIDKVCAGTLIDRQWIVTAGHCTQYCVGYPECAREIAQSEIVYKVIMGEYDQLHQEVKKTRGNKP